MSYKSDLQQNNADLQSILDSVNALPDASDGGDAVETCTVTYVSQGLVIHYAFLKDNGGQIILGNWGRYHVDDSSGTHILYNVVKGSKIMFMLVDSCTYECENVELSDVLISDTDGLYNYFFQINNDCTIIEG